MDLILRIAQEKIQRSLKRGGGAKYFSNSRRGEAAELREDLNSSDVGKQRSAVKRIIANMTLGKDVRSLFVDVVKLGQTNNMELKKLVYLYVLSTAKLQPDKALLAVNTFLQDATHPSPIVRALSIRTMMCIRVTSVLEYTTEALRRAVRDPDPYVRKTAAIGIGKLFHHDMDRFFEQSFQEDLAVLLADTTAAVTSNAAAVLNEVNDYSSETIATPAEIANRLLQHLSECNEWGQCFILEALTRLRVRDGSSAEAMVQRVLPRLSHNNPAVVMAAIKVMASFAGMCSQECINRFTPRVNAALLTLAKSDAETQYVMCKNIHALLIIFPNLLRDNLDAFYVRFSDPPFVKMEKLTLLMKLVTPATAVAIAKELAEYSTEVDRPFVEKVVESIAFLGIKVESVSSVCAELLMKVLHRRPELLPQVITAAKNVVRRYPDLLLLEPLIADFGADNVVEEDAKVSLVWMLGEYCDYIENGRAIIERYIASLMQQEQSVQLAVLSAVIKMFLRDPEAMQVTMNDVLRTITTQSPDPDLRDRAYAYWRLLSNGVNVSQMREIVHGRAATINVDRTFSDAMTMADLKRSINTAAVVFGKPYQSFLPPYGVTADELEESEEEEYPGEEPAEDVDNTGADTFNSQQQQQQGGGGAAPIEDLFAPAEPLPQQPHHRDPTAAAESQGPIAQKTLDDLFM